MGSVSNISFVNYKNSAGQEIDLTPDLGKPLTYGSPDVFFIELGLGVDGTFSILARNVNDIESTRTIVGRISSLDNPSLGALVEKVENGKGKVFDFYECVMECGLASKDESVKDAFQKWSASDRKYMDDCQSRIDKLVQLFRVS